MWDVWMITYGMERDLVGTYDDRETAFAKQAAVKALWKAAGNSKGRRCMVSMNKDIQRQRHNQTQNEKRQANTRRGRLLARMKRHKEKRRAVREERYMVWMLKQAG